jgi:nucleoid-associated protein YgaU
VAPVAVAGDLWSVAAGESMWSIAVTHLRDVHGRDASDEEIATYWRQIVAANALPNPDLLFVGQVIELPAVTPS